MTLFLGLKLLVVLVFLLMFLRRPSLPWGVGLLTVTSAALLDTFFGTFSRDELEADFGFFFFVIAGLLFAGAAFWLFGLLWGRLPAAGTSHVETDQETVPQATPEPQLSFDASNQGIDRKMLYDEIRTRFSREDVLDLAFDLDMNEADVMPLDQSLHHLIINIMNTAEENGQGNALALAVERILTPPPPDHLPRLERISENSPPAILRHYIVANYSTAELMEACQAVKVDWEWLDEGSKKTKARSLLQYLGHRNRTGELVRWMHVTGGVDEEE